MGGNIGTVIRDYVGMTWDYYYCTPLNNNTDSNNEN